MSLTVTATQTGASGTAPGIALTVKVLTGQASSPAGATADSVTATVPDLAITPSGTGSWVYGAVANLAASTAYTAAGTTTFSANVSDTTNGLAYGTFRSTSTTTSGTPVTVGGSAPAEGSGALAVALCEILKGTTLAEDSSSPAAVNTKTAATITTAAFTPPAGSLLVAMVASDGSGDGTHSMTMAVADSSGLTWTQAAVAPLPAGSATYQVASVWTAQVPGGAVTGTGGASLASMHATGSGLVANPVSGTGSASLASMRATGSGALTGPVTASGSASLASMRAAGAGSVSFAAGYPAGPAGATVELLLDGAWTGITKWAMPDGRQYGQITSGQPDGSQQVQPASLSAIWDNADGRFSIRNTSGPYYGQLRQNTAARVSVASVWGTYLRLEGDGPDYAYTADATALHITGSLEARIELMLSDWGPCVFGARYGASGTPSWLWGMQDDGTLLATWYNSSAAQHTAVSTASVPYAPGAMALRVTLNASTGAVAFYTSGGIDGTWTQLGTTVSGSATSVAAGNQPLTAGYSAYGGALGQVHGDIYGFRLYNGIGGTVVADAAFSSQAAETASWTDAYGRTWDLSGGAEVSARDYRLHGELSSIASAVAVSGGQAKVTATLSGRLRRMQQGQAPPTVSPMKQALLARPGNFAPVALWPCEDPAGASQLASAIPGMPALAFVSGASQLSAGSPFGTATFPLPELGTGAQWQAASIPAYTSHGSIILRFALKLGSSLPTSGDSQWQTLMRAYTSGTCHFVDLRIYQSATVAIVGFNSGGSTVFSTILTIGSDDELWGPYEISGPLWLSLEGRPQSGGQVQWSLNGLAPGPTSTPAVLTSASAFSGTIGSVTEIDVYSSSYLTDAVVGMISLQTAWESMADLGNALNAYTGETAAARFRRICGNEGIACRIIGPDAGSAAMGPQPAGSVQQVIADCAAADGGILFEPRTALGVGLRTKASMLSQPAAVTLSFAAADLPGSFQDIDDDSSLINDVTATMADGTSYRAQLNDGSAKSVSEPEDGGAGDYATTVNLNLAADSQLAAAAEWYVAVRSPDDARYSGVVADFGIPGAPVSDIARLRPGDLVVIEDPPDTYQSADIEQLQMGATETFGPGRQIAWDCIPASPWA
jgi:hypothetical protein